MRWRCGDCKGSLYKHRIAPMLQDELWHVVAAHDVDRRLCDACLRHRMRCVLGRGLRFEDITRCRFNMNSGHHQQLTLPGRSRVAYEADVCEREREYRRRIMYLVRHGRTRVHDRKHAGKVTPAMRVYNSKEWKVSRRQAMAAAQYACQHPGCTAALIEPGSCHVHHVKRLQAAWSLAFEPLNHAALCVTHHSIETNREIARSKGKPERSGCDIEGRPLSKDHPWNS